MSAHVPVGCFELLLSVKVILCFAPGFYHCQSSCHCLGSFTHWLFLFLYPALVSPGFSPCSTAKS